MYTSTVLVDQPTGSDNLVIRSLEGGVDTAARVDSFNIESISNDDKEAFEPTTGSVWQLDKWLLSPTNVSFSRNSSEVHGTPIGFDHTRASNRCVASQPRHLHSWRDNLDR